MSQQGYYNVGAIRGLWADYVSNKKTISKFYRINSCFRLGLKVKSKRTTMRTKNNLVFVVNNAAFFVSHRLPIAIEAQKNGYIVDLITGRPGSGILEESAVKKLEKHDITHYKVSFQSSGVNVFTELYGLLQLFFSILKLNPDIIHCASPKGVLYGGMVARIAKVPSLVLAITGMGYGFTDNTEEKNSIKRFAVKKVFDVFLGFVYRHRNKKIIVQNLDDKRIVEGFEFIKSDDVCLIQGSGINLSYYQNISFHNKQDMVLLPARMLKDKGVLEFYMAAKQLKLKGCKWQFVLAGTADYENPSAISKEDIMNWVSEGVVEWLGNVDNMPELYSRTKIVCLPSYREGMPKVLLEAAAAGCAIITTDVIGCREAIKPGVNGDLVPVGSTNHLVDAIEVLINNPQTVKKYGKNGQKLAKEFFDIKMVLNKTLLIYEKLRCGDHNSIK